MRATVLTVLLLSATASADGPFPPHRIIDDVYYVGSQNIACYLVTSNNGHILINSGFEDTVPLIKASVESLGFKMKDVR
ncbi:MAG TPA: subclass B3 metallo-beta-lactamase, partial [Planctomycetaceae bacterium]|nr:subclass B3 metallo-beta-lactamase [Planctomycetaceae bacterium]